MKNDTTSQLLSRSSGVVVVESLIAIILNFSTIAGNVLVFVAVYRNPQLRKVSNVYIVCLSITDFFVGVLVFPITDASIITGKFPGGMNLCWFQAILSFFLAFVSIFTMVMIAVQRYYKIVKPSKHRNIFSPRFVVLSVVLIWCTGIAAIVLLALTGSGVHFYEEFATCVVIMNRITMFVFVDIFGVFLTFFVMSLLYFKIWKFIKSHNAQMTHSNVSAEEVKLTKSLCMVVGAFAVCYTPFVVGLSLAVYEVQLPRQIQFCALCMVALASVVNPIIYGVMNREFRAEFAKIVCYPWMSRVPARVESQRNS